MPVIRLIALPLILLLPEVAFANGGLVAKRPVPVQITIIVDREYPEFEFFLVDHDRIERVRLTPDSPLTKRCDDPRFLCSIDLYAFRKSELAEFGPEGPSAKWFEGHESWPFLAGGSFKPLVDFDDDREQIEQSYRLILTPDRGGRQGGRHRLELVSENPKVRSAKGLLWGGACCVVPLLLIAFAVYLVWRRSRVPREPRIERPPPEQ